jgi:hypothetical protein
MLFPSAISLRPYPEQSCQSVFHVALLVAAQQVTHSCVSL